MAAEPARCNLPNYHRPGCNCGATPEMMHRPCLVLRYDADAVHHCVRPLDHKPGDHPISGRARQIVHRCSCGKSFRERQGRAL